MKKKDQKKVVRRPPVIARAPEPLRLDLGSGPRPAEGFKGVDIVEGVTDFTFDLCSGYRWPWPDNSIDELRSCHFIEHIRADYVGDRVHVQAPASRVIDALLFFFDEAFRIAKPGAVFTLQWPALQSVRAFQDPTHRRFIPPQMTLYLTREGRKAMGVEHYGATCNWIGECYPTFLIPPETDEDKAMALRADASDEKQAWAKRRAEDQQRRYNETWNFSQDFIATLRAVK